MTKQDIINWAADNLEPANPSIGTWEKTWTNVPKHHVVKLRIMEHDNGAWLIVLSCSASYAGDDKAWKGVNLGSVQSISQLDAMLASLAETEVS